MKIGQHGNSLLRVILNESDTYLCQLNQNATTQISLKLFEKQRGGSKEVCGLSAAILLGTPEPKLL